MARSSGWRSSRPSPAAMSRARAAPAGAARGPGGDVPRQGRALRRRARGRLDLADAAQEDGRGQEGERIEQDGQRGADPLHQEPAQGRRGHLGQRAGGAELAVGFEQPLFRHQEGQVGGMGHLEEDGQRADDQGDGIEGGDVEPAGQRQQRQAPQGQGPAQVGGDEQGTPAAAIDPGPGEEAHQDGRGA